MNKFLSYALILVLVLSFILYFVQSNKIDSLQKEITTLRNNPTTVIAGKDLLTREQELLIQLNKDMLTILDRLDSTRVEVETRYIPSEGGYTIITQENPEIRAAIDSILATVRDGSLDENTYNLLTDLMHQLYDTNVDITDHGLCFTPLIGGGIDDDASVGADLGARLYYYQRWGTGLTVGVTPFEDELGLRLDGFIDYRIPRLDNLAPKIYGGYDFSREDGELGVGLDFLLR